MSGGSLVVRAPGKAMLFGEYAVLDGAPALVAAVDRYATAWSVDGAGLPDSAFVREARRAAVDAMTARGLRPRLAGLRIDSSPLYAAGLGGRKLGLGSSAAVTVAAFGVIDGLALEETFAACHAAHSRAQGGEGSGADVAAAVWGGVLRFRRARGSAPEVTPITLADDFEVTLVDTGVAASTADRLARLAALRVDDPARYAAVMAPLVRLAEEVGVAAAAGANGRIPYAAVHNWNTALDALAVAIGLAVVTDAHRAIAACASSIGGAAKPSGAGGGDLAVCFSPAGTRVDLHRRLLALGFEPLDVSVGARGLHRDHAPAAGAAARARPGVTDPPGAMATLDEKAGT